MTLTTTYSVKFNRAMRLWMVVNDNTGRIVYSAPERTTADATVASLIAGFVSESSLVGPIG